MSMNLPQMSPEEAKHKVSKGNFVIIDVREDREIAVSNLGKASVPYTHIKMSEIVQRLDEIPKEKELGIICHTGSRSARVTMFLRQRGYNAINIQGGIENWARTVDANIPRY